jgi:hypothetical protein
MGLSIKSKSNVSLYHELRYGFLIYHNPLLIVFKNTLYYLLTNLSDCRIIVEHIVNIFDFYIYSIYNIRIKYF